ncbi:MAG TPA: winged helix-turn-helix domain-containing protein [Terriglobales bacterium]
MVSKALRVQEKIKFGTDEAFELDLNAYELRHSGRQLKLERIPMEVLLFLIEHNDRLVSREEIVERIWGKGVFLDTDNAINGAVRKIRLALKDDPELPRFVQTVTGRGYRFIAPVSGDAAGDEKGRPSESPDGPRLVSRLARDPDGNWIKTRAAAIALLIVIAIAIAIGSALWLLPIISHWTSASAPLRSIAVLPLDNLTGDPSQDFFVDGMTDELTTDLAKVSSLRVVSRTSAMRYKGAKKGLPQIARELNVAGIVEGSVMRSGGRVRITAQLINASTDQHLWAETYERDLEDVLRLQNEVAEAIAQQVRAQLTADQKAALRSAPTVNPEAYDAYLKGRFYLTSQFTTEKPLRAAKSYFEESVRKDPNFALAYSGLADSELFLAFFRFQPAEQAAKPAKEALRKALELDHSLGEPHDPLGLLSWRFDWDWAAAQREFNQAITLAPSYSCAHEDRAMFLAFLGQRAEALAEVAKSNELDPGPSSAGTEAAVYYLLRDYQGLLNASRRGVVSDSSDWVEYYNLGIGYEGTGKLLEAIVAYEKAVEMSGGDQDAMASLAHAYAVIGRKPEAKRIFHDLQQKSGTAETSPYLVATVYAGLGDKELAFQFLEKAYREKSLEISWHIKADVRIDNLRSDPRYTALLRKMGLEQ